MAFAYPPTSRDERHGFFLSMTRADNHTFVWQYNHMRQPDFEWDEAKDRANRAKHGVGFEDAQRAFFDPCRVIAEDLSHSSSEQRYFCFGEVDGGVMTVRFTWRAGRIRIFGAGYWRKGKKIYEQETG